MIKDDKSNPKIIPKPIKELDLKTYGFIGSFFQPEENRFPGKAVILFGGSDGNYELTKTLAGIYSKKGMTVLALAYWNQPGLPDHFEKIPVDYIEKAAIWLKENIAEKVGLWGISKGAELALLAASFMPELISSVVAVCPSNIIGQGFIKKRGLKKLPFSSWSYHNKEIPYTKLEFSPLKILRDCIKERGMAIRSCYENAFKNSPEKGQIKVENIKGPILLLYPENDTMWNSKLASQMIMSRLEEHDFKFPYRDYAYKYASHLLVPLNLKESRIFRIERQFPERCRESRLDSLEKTFKFWSECWI